MTSFVAQKRKVAKQSWSNHILGDQVQLVGMMRYFRLTRYFRAKVYNKSGISLALDANFHPKILHRPGKDEVTIAPRCSNIFTEPRRRRC